MASRGDHIRLEKGSLVKGQYEVLTPIGAGNFSKVYRVIDSKLPAKVQRQRVLAMKVIKREYSRDAKYEMQMLTVLQNHDTRDTARVSKMYEFFMWQDCPVFIMPIHGPSLRDRRLGLHRGLVTRQKLLQFSYNLLETMKFVHFDCHMVHTDLKPENILIADRNAAEDTIGDSWVVCDFGSASLWRMDKLDSDLISTRPYRAPEVILGNKWHYAADMWSVGCIIYEVAVGARLFEIHDDMTHLHMMDRRIGRLPEMFVRRSRYSSRFFNSRGDFLSTPDVIRLSKCRLTPIRDMFKNERDFLQLLRGLLAYNPDERMTATEALALPVFDMIRRDYADGQRQVGANAEPPRQHCLDAEKVIHEEGTSPRLISRSDSNTLEQFVGDGRKQSSDSGAHHVHSAASVLQASGGGVAYTWGISKPTADGDAAASASTKDAQISHGHEHYRQGSELRGSSPAGGRLDRAAEARSAASRGAALEVPAVRCCSAQCGDQAATEASVDAACAAARVTPVTSEVRVEDAAFPSKLCASAGLATSLNLQQISKKADVCEPRVMEPSLKTEVPSSRMKTTVKDAQHPCPTLKNLRPATGVAPLCAPLIPPERLDTPICAAEDITKAPPPRSGQRGSGGSTRNHTAGSRASASSKSKTTSYKGASSGSHRSPDHKVVESGGTQSKAQSSPKSPRGQSRAKPRSKSCLGEISSPTGPGSSKNQNRSLGTRAPAIAPSPMKTTRVNSDSGLAASPAASMSSISVTQPLRPLGAVTRQRDSATSDPPPNPTKLLSSKGRRVVAEKTAAGVSATVQPASSLLFSKRPLLSTVAPTATIPQAPLRSSEMRLGYMLPVHGGVTRVNKGVHVVSLHELEGSNVHEKRRDVDQTGDVYAESISDIGGGGGSSNNGMVQSPSSASPGFTKNDVATSARVKTIDDGRYAARRSSMPQCDHVTNFAVSPMHNQHHSALRSLDECNHTTEYCSAARCHPSSDTSAGNTVAASLPVAANALTAPLCPSRIEFRPAHVESVASVTAAWVSGEKKASVALSTAPNRQSFCRRNFTPPRLNDGFRSPRTCSPALWSPSLFAGQPSTPRRTSGSSPVSLTVKSGHVHELASTIPLPRAQLSRTNTGRVYTTGTLKDTPASAVDPISHARPSSACTTPRASNVAFQVVSATNSTSTTTAPTSPSSATVHRRRSLATQPVVVMAAVDHLEPVWPLKISDVHGTTPSPVTASQCKQARLGLVPAASGSAPACSGPPLVQKIPTASPAAASLSCLVSKIPLSEDGLVNPNIPTDAVLLAAPTASSNGASDTATESHQPLGDLTQRVHTVAPKTGGTTCVIRKARTMGAVSTAAMQSRRLHPQQGSLVSPNNACEESGPSSLVAADPAAAASRPVPTSASGACGAGKSLHLSLSNGSGNCPKWPRQKHSQKSPVPSRQQNSSSLSRNFLSGASEDQLSPRLSIAALTDDDIVILHKRRSSQKGEVSKSGVSALPPSVVAVRVSSSASMQGLSKLPNSLEAIKKGTDIMQSLTGDVNSTPVRDVRNSSTGGRSPRTPFRYRRTGSPMCTSPAQANTSSPRISMDDKAVSVSRVPLSMQLLHEKPSQKEQHRPVAADKSAVEGSRNSPSSIIAGYSHTQVTPMRKSVHQKSFSKLVASKSPPNALDRSAASRGRNKSASSTSSSRPPSAVRTDAPTSTRSHHNPASPVVPSRQLLAQQKQRHDARTLRRIIVVRPSRVSLPQTSSATS